MTQSCPSCVLLSMVLCVISVPAMAQGNQSSPRTEDRHPDLNGLWIGQRAPFVQSEDTLAQNLASRDGTLLNFECDKAIIRRSDLNKSLYKPALREMVQKLHYNGNTQV